MVWGTLVRLIWYANQRYNFAFPCRCEKFTRLKIRHGKWEIHSLNSAMPQHLVFLNTLYCSSDRAILPKIKYDKLIDK